MMQNEQRLLQPSWIFRFGPRAVARRVFHGRRKKVVLREDVAHVDVAVIGRARSAAMSRGRRCCVLCEFPTTHSTPGMRGQFLRARAARSSRSPGSARPDSRGVRGGWSAAHRRRPRTSPCRCSGRPGRRALRSPAASSPCAASSDSSAAPSACVARHPKFWTKYFPTSLYCGASHSSLSRSAQWAAWAAFS